MTSGAWQSIAADGVAGLALVLVAARSGFGLASIGRHTAMALGVAIGVVIVFQFGLGTVLAMAKVKFAEAYLLPLWMIAWMGKKYEVQDYNSCDFSLDRRLPAGHASRSPGRWPVRRSPRSSSSWWVTRCGLCVSET